MTYREYIDGMKKKYVGVKVKYAGEDYTIVDVDYNGGLLIDKPARFTETTAIYEFDPLLHLSGQV